MATKENGRKAELPGALREYFSAIASIISFWAIVFLWNAVFRELEAVPRLGFGAALSWVVFLHAEVMGMILMSIMRWRMQEEARSEALAEMMKQMRAEAREARAEAREAQAEARADAREAQAEARDALLEAREAQIEAREARLEARESREIIRDLERQLREARGESANGANGE